MYQIGLGLLFGSSTEMPILRSSFIPDEKCVDLDLKSFPLNFDTCPSLAQCVRNLWQSTSLINGDEKMDGRWHTQIAPKKILNNDSPDNCVCELCGLFARRERLKEADRRMKNARLISNFLLYIWPVDITISGNVSIIMQFHTLRYQAILGTAISATL